LWAQGTLAEGLRPGDEAVAQYQADRNVKDCKTAEAAYLAIKWFPYRPQVAYGPGRSQICLYPIDPKRISAGLYEITRAVALDPTLGGTTDAKVTESYLKNIYIQYHGTDEGMQQLKEIARTSPVSPDGYRIEAALGGDGSATRNSAKSILLSRFSRSIKRMLTDELADAYFFNSLEDVQIPKLKGTVVGASPTCRSTKLLTAFSDATHAEVILHLDSPVPGMPKIGSQIQWEGVSSALTRMPFTLTMDTERRMIENLIISPCAARR
jgi:hypothetical protein